MSQALNSTKSQAQAHYEKFAKLLLSLHRLKGRVVAADIIEFAKLVLSVARRYCVEAELHTKNKSHYLYCSFGNERGVRVYFKVVGVCKGNKVMIKRILITDLDKVFEYREDEEELIKRELEEILIKTEKAEKLENELENKLLNIKLPKNRKEVAKIIENAVNEVLNKLGGCMYSGFELRDIKVFASGELVDGVRHILASVVCGYNSFDIGIKATHNVVTDIDVKEDTEFDPHCYLYGDLDEECWE